MQRAIILIHRYLGIPMSILFVAWFGSGIVMMYTGGMPALSGEDQLDLRQPLNLADIRLSPAAAAERAGLAENPASLKVFALFGRPAYRHGGSFGRADIVFADSGEQFTGADPDNAKGVVSSYSGLPLQQIDYLGSLNEPDQWTLTEQRHLPMLHFALNDESATQVYVSQRTADIVLVTNRTSRALAWIGAIPHWIYFTPLRANQPLWYWTIVCLSVLGCLSAVLGLVLTVTQFQRSVPFRLSESIRYRGLMRWHYYAGALFGVFALTWVFSGLLSMDPFEWNERQGLLLNQDALADGPVDVRELAHLDENRWASLASGSGAKEIEFIRIHGDPYMLIRYSSSAKEKSLLLDARTLERRSTEFSTDAIVARLESGTDAQVSSVTHMSSYDSYYYDRDRRTPLPVLRIEFDDPEKSWIYVDPVTSRIVGRTHRYARLDRWLFTGLHSLDFSFWYDKRPLWDIVLIILSIGGLVISGIGTILGYRRMRRAFTRIRTRL